MIASASPTIPANEIRWDATCRRSGLAASSSFDQVPPSRSSLELSL